MILIYNKNLFLDRYVMINDINNKLYEMRKLKNGLALEMFFISKPVAGDRCQVVFEAQVDIELTEGYFGDKALSEIGFRNARTLLGKKVTFNYQKIRNFISNNEKENVFESLRDAFISASLSYLSSSDFPARVIEKKYNEARSKTALLEKRKNIA